MNILVNDFRMSYNDVGKGLPVILLHGFPLSREIWAPQISAISSRYRLITPDLRGHGDSEATSGPYTMDLLADDIASLIDGLDLRQKVVLGGLSMGGYVAMAFARRHPQRLAGLFLTATRADADAEAGKEGRQKAIAAAQQACSSLPAVESMLPKLFAPPTYTEKPDLVDKVRKIMERTSLAGVIHSQQGMMQRPDSYDMLYALEIPGLMIYGDQDQIIPEEAAVKTGATFADGSMAAIKNAGHLLNMEQPDEFNAILLEWLEQF